MSIIDLFRKGRTRITDPDYSKKKYVMRYLTLKELNKLAKEYISENPKFYYVDHNGIERNRKPSRNELEEYLLKQIPLEILLNIFPKLKKKIEVEE